MNTAAKYVPWPREGALVNVHIAGPVIICVVDGHSLEVVPRTERNKSTLGFSGVLHTSTRIIPLNQIVSCVNINLLF